MTKYDFRKSGEGGMPTPGPSFAEGPLFSGYLGAQYKYLVNLVEAPLPKSLSY